MSVLVGTAGPDTLNTLGATYDSAQGLAGDDLYIVDPTDTVTEAANAGVDTVELHLTSVAQASGWVAPVNIENLVVVSTLALTAGDAAANTLSGSGVQLRGLAGDDVLFNNGFSATIMEGGDGDDQLVSASFKNQRGSDLLVGGKGDDIYVVYSGDTIVELAGQGLDKVSAYSDYTLPANVEELYAAYDGFVLTGNAGDNKIVGTTNNYGLYGLGGDDWISGRVGGPYIADGGDGVDTMSFAGVGQGVTIRLGSDANYIHFENVEGSSYADTLTGTAGDNVLKGFYGDDFLQGLAGNDVLDGGDGWDTAIYAEATSALTIDLNLTTAQNVGGGAGNDTLLAIENLQGGAFNDTFIGTLDGNTFDGGEGDDILNGGDGLDAAVYARSTGVVIVDLSITGRQNTQTQGYDTLISIENLVGSSYGDGLAGNAQANIIDGGAGQDYMAGGAGDDTYMVDNVGDNPVEGLNAGYDTVISQVNFTLNANLEVLTLVNGQNGVGNALDNLITGNSDANNLQGWDGSDQLYGQGGADLIYGQNGIDYLYGGDGDDTLDGGDAGDALLGGNGNDLLIGGAGQDWMEGGAGNDSYIVQDVGDNPMEAAGAGTDIVYSYVSLALNDNIETLWLVGTGALNGVGNDQANSLSGNADANNLMGRGGADSIAGYEGDDTLSGGDGNDLLDGAAGADWLYGDDGSDTLNAGDGGDVLIGGAGDDVMSGGLGDDVYVVDSAGDQLVEIAGQGAETVYSSVTLTLAPNVETLWLVGPGPLNGTGNSIGNGVVGNDSDNVLSGLGGDDFLIGYGGADQLFGGFERDFLNGGSGADLLVGGGGGDRLYGETGADIFRYDTAADSRIDGSNDDRDAIMDFQVGLDHVDLRNVHTSGADTFSLLPDSSGTAQLIQVDLGGDGSIDMEIVLFNVTNATTADILW